MNRLNILTVADYPTFLPLLQASIQHNANSEKIDLHWSILKTHDKPLPALSLPHTIIEGKTEEDFINDIIQENDGYFYIANSDNCLHPDLVQKTILANNIIQGFVFPQILEDGALRDIKIAPSCIDRAQFIFHKKSVGDTKWLAVSGADGYFIDSIYNDYFKKLDTPLAYLKKASEYLLLKTASKTLEPGVLVSPNRDYYEEFIKPSLNPVLRGTITHLNRMCGKKFQLLSINDLVVNIVPLRTSNPFYKNGKGILLIFEDRKHIDGCLKLLEWDQPYSAELA